MGNMKIIYQILKALDKSLDFEELNPDCISADRLNVSYERWEQLLIMLYESGYIDGLIVTKGFADCKPHITKPIQPRITLKGLEYLENNSTMAKIEKAVKGIAEIVIQ